MILFIIACVIAAILLGKTLRRIGNYLRPPPPPPPLSPKFWWVWVPHRGDRASMRPRLAVRGG